MPDVVGQAAVGGTRGARALRLFPRAGCLLALLLVTAAPSALAADRYWVPGGTGSWNSTTNWSATDGGGRGASVPGAADNAIINGNSGSAAFTISQSVNISVLSLTLNNGFCTFNQAGNRTITVGTGGWTQSNGTFNGSGRNVTMSGPLVLSGGSYRATSATFAPCKAKSRDAASPIPDDAPVTTTTLSRISICDLLPTNDRCDLQSILLII